MVKINTIFSAERRSAGSWDGRPANASDGDYYQVTNAAIYRYSDDIGEWVRPFIYDGTPVLDVRIQGSVLPENESPAWVQEVSGITIATDGTKVTLPHGGTWEFSRIYYDHGQTQKSHFFQGNIEHDDEQYHVGEGFAIVDGVRVGHLVLDSQSDGLRLYINGDATKGERNAIVNLEGRERYLEFYMAASGSHKGVFVYVDHEEFPSNSMMYETLLLHGAGDDYIQDTVNSGSIYFLGAASTRGGGAEIILRECFFGRY